MKQETMRSCIGCGAKKPKKELIRIVREPDGSIHPDASGRSNGRGAYLCRKTNGLNRAFREQVTSSVYAALEKEFTELNDGPCESD